MPSAPSAVSGQVAAGFTASAVAACVEAVHRERPPPAAISLRKMRAGEPPRLFDDEAIVSGHRGEATALPDVPCGEDDGCAVPRVIDRFATEPPPSQATPEQ